MAVLRGTEPPRLIDHKVLKAALVSGNQALRAGAAWYIALRYRKGRGEGRKELGRAVSEVSLDAGSDSLLAAVALARRALGGRREDDPAVLRYAQDGQEDDTPTPVETKACRFTVLSDLLGPKERDAARALLEGCEIVRWKAEEPQHGSVEVRGPRGWLRTLTAEVPRAMIAGVVAESGCRLDESKAAIGGLVRYGPDGRAAEVEFLKDTPSDECGTALRTLLLLSEPNLIDEPPCLYILPLKASQIACITTDPVRLVAEKGDVVRPAEIVRQAFPEDLKDDPIGIDSSYRCTVSAAGCLAGIQTAIFDRSPREVFAVADAMLGWEFRPGTRNGKPQESTLTIDVDPRRKQASTTKLRSASGTARRGGVLHWVE
jgi:hypothetical protein